MGSIVKKGEGQMKNMIVAVVGLVALAGLAADPAWP